MDLQSAIQNLSARFAIDLVGLLRNATLDELAALGTVPAAASNGASHAITKAAPRAQANGIPKQLPSGRLRRRTEADLKEMVTEIVDLVKKHPGGVNAESIRADLKIERRELPKPLGMALATKKIKKQGRKRGTLYIPA
jgi:hypothetical protein